MKSSRLRRMANVFGVFWLPGLRNAWSREILLHRKGLEFEIDPPLMGASGLADVVLGPDLVLFKKHNLPLKARREARRILALQAMALSDAGRVPLVEGSLRIGTRTGSDTYLQGLLKSEDLKNIVAHIENLGWQVRSVSAEQEGQRVPLLDNSAEKDFPIVAWWNIGMLIGLAFLITSIFAERQTLGLGEEMLVAHRDRQVELQNDISQISVSSESRLEQERSIYEAAKSLSLGLDAILILGDLTKAVPDEAWLTELSIDPAKVQLAGKTSGPASEMMAQLDALSWVVSVSPEAPIVVDRRTGDSSFVLNVERTYAGDQP